MVTGNHTIQAAPLDRGAAFLFAVQKQKKTAPFSPISTFFVFLHSVRGSNPETVNEAFAIISR